MLQLLGLGCGGDVVVAAVVVGGCGAVVVAVVAVRCLMSSMMASVVHSLWLPWLAVRLVFGVDMVAGLVIAVVGVAVASVGVLVTCC